MLEDQISQDYIKAMKAKDSVKSSTLNFLRAQLKNVQIEKKTDKLQDTDVITVIKKQVKQRQDSIEQFKKGGREDLAAKEEGELEILNEYLPEQISEDQIKKIIEEVIKETGAGSVKDMGKVMKEVSAITQGQADNRLVSEIVKSTLMQS